MNLRRLCVLAAIGVGLSASAQMPDQYPKPLPHTTTDHPAGRVLIVSVDGLRAINLANFISSHPQSALSELTRRGVSYTNAHVTWPDPASGLLEIVSGGSPDVTGIFSSEGYDRALQRDGKNCARAALPIDLSAGHAVLSPAEGNCAALQPHRLLRINTIFDLVHAAGGRTAWADANAAYVDLLRGPSGEALDEVFVPHAGPEPKNGISAAEQSDRACVDAMLRWIGARSKAPRLAGLSLSGLDAAQRSLPLAQTSKEGAASGVKRSPLEHIDAQLQRIVIALKSADLFDSTWIVVTAPHGSLGDTANLRVVDADSVVQIAQSTAGDELAHVRVGTAAMVWLQHPVKTDAVVKAYRAKMLDLGIAAIFSGEKLKLILNTAKDDSRMPDVILEPQAGVVWATDGQWPRHLGGYSDDENHVALLISGRQLTGRIDKTLVPTAQVAPLILRALGMGKFDLQALHIEHVPALPGIF